MTTTSSDGLYLDPDQQDLLLRALQSNSDSRLFTSPSVNQVTQSLKHNSQNGTPDSMGSQYGNGTPPPTAALNGSFADGTPLMGGDLDYPDWDADGPWDFETGLDGVDNSMNGTSYSDTPGSMSQDNDKRKSPPSNDDGSPSSDPHDAEPKRRGGFIPSSCLHKNPSFYIVQITFLKYIYIPNLPNCFLFTIASLFTICFLSQ
jgi:AP-1-like factor